MGNPQAEPKALELLREELSSEDIYVKVNAIHRLRIVATLLGHEGVVHELLPYLESNLYIALLSEEEELLFALAQELGALHSYVAPSPAVLIPLLGSLAGMDETVVREEATRSLSMVAGHLSDSDLINVLVPVILKLASADNFSSRVSASGLLAVAYARSGNSKERFRTKLLDLSRDDIPMVRRAAAGQMGIFAQVMDKSVLVAELLPELRQLAQDEQDQIRIIYVDSLIEIAQLLNKEENRMHTLPIILAIGDDKSWKVRCHFAMKFPKLAEALGKEITESALIQTFAQLLRDPESDVKAVALQSLTNTLHNISRERLQALIFPGIESLANDSSLPPKVRKNAASVVTQMCQFLGKEFSVNKIIPLIQNLLQEENYEVKMQVVEGLGCSAGTIGTDLVTSSLVGVLQGLTKNSPQWRLRVEVYRACVELTKCLGSELFSDQLQDIFLGYLSDTVNVVRTNVTDLLGELAGLMGNCWVETQLFPRLQEVFYNAELGYLHRISVLNAICCVNASTELIRPLLIAASKDKVPNVRFCLCRTVGTLDKQTEMGEFKEVLRELAQDADRDVSYFAQKAFNGLV